MNIAVIDLGTNTFNLLIIEPLTQGKFNIKYSNKLESKLGRGGIHNSIITPEAMQRGISCLKQHKLTIEKFNCSKVLAFGTSALRNATNADEFIKKSKQETGIDITVISGDAEAELIFLGNKWAVEMPTTSLILDIGGGSNEFIIADKNTIYWKKSFELGMQRLLNMFPLKDPICLTDLTELEQYFDKQLLELTDALLKYPTNILVGSSGSFDTFRQMLEQKNNDSNTSSSPTLSYSFTNNDFEYLHTIFTTQTQDTLRQIDSIDLMRVEMLPIASVFVNYIIKKYSIKTIIQSSYSLKEGAVFKYLL
ncbi:MAG: phosphatase [Bacteroidales bacterium]|nr:phosphatase [Bacteroidales bacterium]